MARKTYDWSAVQAYHDEGHGLVECTRRFGFTYAALKKAAKRGKVCCGIALFGDRRRRYDWSLVQAYYDAGHSFRQTRTRFGFSTATRFKAAQRGEVKSRRFGMPISELLASPRRNRSHIKSRLIAAGLLENRCKVCQLTSWRGEALNMHLDHINGIKNDNRLDNLRMLCPNCHSRTLTYSGRNARRAKVLQEPASVL